MPGDDASSRGLASGAMGLLTLLVAPAEVTAVLLWGAVRGGIVFGSGPALLGASAASGEVLTEGREARPWAAARAVMGPAIRHSWTLLGWALIGLVLSVELVMALLGLLPGGWLVVVPLALVLGFYLRCVVIRTSQLGPGAAAGPAIAGTWWGTILMAAAGVPDTARCLLATLGVALVAVVAPAVAVVWGPGLLWLLATRAARRSLSSLGGAG